MEFLTSPLFTMLVTCGFIFLVVFGSQLKQILRDYHPRYKDYLFDRAKHMKATTKPAQYPLPGVYPLAAVPLELSITYPSFSKWLRMEHISEPMNLDFTNTIGGQVDADYVFTYYFNKSNIIVMYRDLERYLQFKTEKWNCNLSYMLIEKPSKKTYLIDGKYFVQGDLAQFEEDMMSLRLLN
jgi:hypothetical protein